MDTWKAVNQSPLHIKVRLNFYNTLSRLAQLLPPFTEKDLEEVQRGQVIFLSSHSLWLKWGDEFGQSDSKPAILTTPWRIGEESTSQCRRCGFDPWVGKTPWKRKLHPTPVFLPGKSHGQRSLVGWHPWGHKESDTTEHACPFLFLTEIKFSLKVYNFSTSIFAQLSKHHHHLITGQSHPSERKPWTR